MVYFILIESNGIIFYFFFTRTVSFYWI